VFRPTAEDLMLAELRRHNQEYALRMGRTWGANGVELSAHALCAEDHLPYQGRQFSFAEFAELQRKLDRPIGSINCLHFAFPIITGASPPAHTAEMLAEYGRLSLKEVDIGGVVMPRYKWFQELRKIEDNVREQKEIIVIAQVSGDTPLCFEAQTKINDLLKRYHIVMQSADLSARYQRLKVDGYRPVKLPKS
jgi:hypothetical protein